MESLVDWMLSLAPARARKLRSLGARIGRPLPIGITEETELCEESVLERDETSGCLKISALVSRCSKRLQKRMPFPTETGAARSRMP